MARTHVLLIAFLVAGATLPATVTAAATTSCAEGSAASGLCVDASGSGESVDLTGSQGGGGDQGDTSPDGDGAAPGATPPDDAPGGGGPIDPTAITDTLGTCQSDRCGDNGTPTITLTDPASFTPTTPTIHLEPNGWALLNKPTNAIADTTTNTHNGTLLGHPITARFTPTTYHWSWGDNTHDTFTTPGATWDTLKLPRFSPTATSHTYTERGPVTVTLAIDYTVDYQLDNTTWTTITGTVAATTTTNALVVTAQTVNVPDNCTTTPTAPGC